MKAMWASPEGKAKMAERDALVAEQRAADPTKFTRTGVPTGYTKATVAPLLAEAGLRADRFIQKMKDEEIIPADDVVVPGSDEAKAEAALREAYVMAIGPFDRQSKLAACRTVLEWTRAKPASKASISVNSSEDWLAAIHADDVSKRD
jgi:hypothetical protein